MVKHQPLQYYEPQLCLSCLTGIYGCRWKRYQRSHDDTTKWERLWFLILTFSFFLTLIWFYFWWEGHNDYNEINWFLYNRMGYWSDWSIPILVTTAAGFMYITALLILALCHIAVGQQMNLHWIHKVGLITTLITTVVTMCSVAQLWDDEWEMVVISLQATAPFLHIGALVAVTALSWLVSGQFARAERATSQMLMFGAYFAVVLALYLIPLAIYSPCIMQKKDLGPKPAIIGHRGAPMMAPENTLMSFQKAVEQKVYGVQADVVISYDGVPFLMHDETLRRTTDVEVVFPELAHEHASMFNWTDLQRLNAGEWFLKMMWLPDSQRRLVQEIAPGFQQTSGIKAGAQPLRDRGFRKLNLRYTKVTSDDIREYTAANLSVNLYIVNEPWLYSILWCSGVQSVTSDNSHVLSRVPSPIWLMPPDEYCLIWITADLISFVIIVGVFIFQKWRLGSIHTYNPEQIMLSAAVRRSSRDVNIMKEKLIFSVHGMRKALFQHHISNELIFLLSTFFTVQLSHPYIEIRNTLV
ncbi:glycerophosphodiester phosphodiesterase domain-containing protein 5 isoform X4 [Rhineura floridana]|uniref:glycerophosphodiester phosphodiesterase domain-containing protein 5 isoform X4 n=1 Tax=Rhineura floridana TaxID=261503 RepID=UPI002AC82791|nr:glycerophosphodiester phosphodiesterase domain-containing protein 5 isoform X4 [Rhineura floridana]